MSATLYQTFLACPQQALGRMLGEYPAPSVASFRGSLAHRVFARHLAAGPIPDDQLEQACREEIGAGLNLSLGSLGLKPSQLAPVLAEVGDLYERFKRFPQEGFRAAEVDVEADVGGEVTLKGKVDAIFDDPRWGTKIVDWKTGVDLSGSKTQLEFYSLVWALQEDELPGMAEAVSVRTGERVSIEPSVEEATRTASRVAEAVSQLRTALSSSTELDRVGGPGCRYCPLLPGCREGAAAVALTGAG